MQQDFFFIVCRQADLVHQFSMSILKGRADAKVGKASNLECIYSRHFVLPDEYGRGPLR